MDNSEATQLLKSLRREHFDSAKHYRAIARKEPKGIVKEAYIESALDCKRKAQALYKAIKYLNARKG